MSEGYCRVTLLGNLGEDAALRFGQSGTAVLKWRMAVTTSYIDKDKQRKEKTGWHSVVCFGKRAEGLAKVLTKGTTVFVEGDLETRSYDDKDGVKKWVTEIVMREIVLCGGGRRGQAVPPPDDGFGEPPARGGGGGGYQRGGPPPVAPPDDGFGAPPGGDDADIPF